MSDTFFINPPMTSVRYHGKPVSRTRWKKSGFSRNPKRKRAKPTARQLAAQRKFATMARARAAGAKKKSRAHTSSTGSTMARRKRKAATRRSGTSTRRRRSSARRRVSINPPKRRRRAVRRAGAKRGRRRSFRRNPPMLRGIVGQVMDIGVAAGGVVVGRVAYNFVDQQFGAKIASASDSPTVAALKKLATGAVVAVGLEIVGRKMGGRAGSLARYAAAGALAAPLATMATSFMPSAAPYLAGGVMAMPAFAGAPARRQLRAYAPPTDLGSYSGMGSYSGSSQPY